MAHHNLKIFDVFFQDVVDNKKRAEIRINDRDYKVGDTVTLKEGYPEDGEFIYSGREICAIISYVNGYGCQHDYVCLSLADVGLLIIRD